ncbi:hypothetical protein E7T06_08925 [Deinococcus sp. Arct2-2]|uniref:hypothetical protein n=1 Tax=Deinococcus sp. Arct2-2 TaxID=2568653 RepID=UPI0010A2FDB2|nr:hypothetical protein [Deinococcus sp. Arct2-2]THF70161.1 hypothetical protein E7T06_08925 [Deinococcus sp. Arct2-2]
MDLESWKPDDNARRLATLIGSFGGVFAFVALWMGLSLNPFLALLCGVVIGLVLFALLRPLLRAVFGR